MISLPPRGLANQRGTSLIELFVYIGMTYFIVTWTAYFIRMPVRINAFDQKRQAEVTAVRAVDLMISDLREASPASFDWTQIPSLPPDPAVNKLVFSKNTYDLTKPFDPPVVTQVQYELQPASAGLMNLVRTVAAPAVPVSSSTVLSNLDSASTSQYFVQQDTTSTHILTISLSYHFAPETNPVRIVRRVAIQG